MTIYLPKLKINSRQYLNSWVLICALTITYTCFQSVLCIACFSFLFLVSPQCSASPHPSPLLCFSTVFITVAALCNILSNPGSFVAGVMQYPWQKKKLCLKCRYARVNILVLPRFTCAAKQNSFSFIYIFFD